MSEDVCRCQMRFRLSVTQGGDSALDNQNLGSVTVDGFADSEDPESYRVIASHRR